MQNRAAPVSDHNYSLQQHPAFGAALNAIGAQCQAFTFDGGQAQVIRRHWPILGSVALISRGPIWDAAPQSGALITLRRALGARHLIINASSTADAATMATAGFIQIAKSRQVAELDLLAPEKDRLARMTGKWRNRLRHAQKQGLRVVDSTFTGDPGHWLFARDAEQQERNSYQAMPITVICAMALHSPGSVRLFTAKRAGTPIAAMLFLRHGNTVSYQIGWSGAQGREVSAHNLLMWEAANTFARQGHHQIDMGVYHPNTAPGLARFKHGAGAVHRALGGTWLDSGALAPMIALRRAWQGRQASLQLRATGGHERAGSP